MLPVKGVEYELAHVMDDRVEWQTFVPRRPPLTYPGFSIGAGQCWMNGFSGLYQRSLNPTSLWHRVAAFEGVDVKRPVVTGNEVLFLFAGGRSGNPGCALYHNNEWIIRYGDFDHAVAGLDGKTLFVASRNGVYIRREAGTLDLQFLSLPANGPVGRIIQDKDETLWISTSEGVLHYHPGQSPPSTRVNASLTEIHQETGLPVSFGGVRRFSTANPPEAFRYSWRFDGGPWSHFECWLGLLLPLPGLQPGPHRLEVRASDADGNVDPTPVVLSFTMLSVPLQQRAWFTPLVGLVMVLIACLSWLGIARTRQIARQQHCLAAGNRGPHPG